MTEALIFFAGLVIGGMIFEPIWLRIRAKIVDHFRNQPHDR